MTRATTPLAVAADYADALMTARRAKNLLFLLLFLFVLLQLACFFLARYGVVHLGGGPAPTSMTVMPGITPPPPPAADAVPATGPTASADAASTQPSLALTQPVAPAAGRDADRWEPLVRYVVPIVGFGAVALSIVLVVVLLLLVTIMLVGRLIGVSSVTGAFVWAVLLVVLLVPWQTFLIQDGSYPVAGSYPATGAGVAEQPAFKFPGALYTYAELKRDYQQAFAQSEIWPRGVWFWGRYAGMPGLALLLLLIVQFKSSRGLKYALGEADINVEVTTNQKDISVV